MKQGIYNNIFIKYKYPVILSLIIFTGLLLRTRLSLDACLHQWDERFHALVAKHMMDNWLRPVLYENPVLNYDYRRWYSNHIWLHKQPLPLWSIALSYKAFGLSEFATRIPSILLSTLAIFITYLLGGKIFSKKAGLLAAFFMAVNGLVIEMAAGRIATDHYDTLFLAFIEISVLFAYYNSQNRRLFYAVLSGAFMALAILTKWLPALIILPVHFLMLANRDLTKREIFKQTGASLITCFVLCAPWQLYILYSFPLEARWEYFYNWLHMATELDGHKDDGYLYYLDKIRVNYSEIIYAPLFYLIYQLAKSRFKDRKLLALTAWIFIPILFFSFAKTKMQGYILFISPALFIITADFFFVLKDELMQKTNNKWLLVFSKLLLVAIIVLPLRYCFERTAFGLSAPEHTEYADRYKALKDKFPERSVVLNVQQPVDFMFYNNCIAYTFPKISAQDSLMITQKGYRIFYLEE